MELLEILEKKLISKYSTCEQWFKERKSDYRPDSVSVARYEQKMSFVRRLLSKSDRVTDRTINNTINSMA